MNVKSFEILALDVGQARIGVARADSQVKLVEPLEIINRKKTAEFDRLKEILKTYRPTLIIVGLPYNSNFQVSNQGLKIKAWTKKLQQKTNFSGKIIYYDETLTTHQARQTHKSKNRVQVDDLAAAIILDDYLSESF